MTAIQLLKHTLRTPLRQLRKQLSAEFIKTHSEIICQQIQATTAYQHAQTIGFYSAHQGEVDLASLITHAQSQHKSCYLPIIQHDTLHFAPIKANTPFKKNVFGISEPLYNGPLLQALNLDLIIMPLIAFDSQCQRLGLGGGFYDKTLSPRPSSILMGVAYAFQWVPLVPTNAYDIPLDYVITEHTIYRKPS